MANKYAKWVGGALGWAFGGPIGGLVGFSLGYLWDNASLDGRSIRSHQRRESKKSDTHSGDFALALLVLSASVMKADDRVLKAELNFVKRFLIHQFGERKTRELLRVLRDLLEQEINLIPVCQQINAHMSHAQRLELTHFLIGIAYADGHLHRQEWIIIRKIARYLNVNPRDLGSIEAMFNEDEERYYRILEIDKGASLQDVKRAYRKMAKKYHPDRLGDVGNEVKEAAVAKFRMVQEAYDYITKIKTVKNEV